MAFQSNNLLPPIRGLLIDISGTLLIGSSPISSAAQSLTILRAARIPFRLCSNTSKESTDALHRRMSAAGLDVRREELWTSIGALRTILKELGLKRPYMLLSKSAREECADGPAPDLVPGGDHGDRSSLSNTPLYDAVVVGLAPPLLDYAHLNTAFRILIGEDHPRGASSSLPNVDSNISAQSRPPLIALHKALYIEASDHALSLGTGPFVRALEDAARTTATVVGKPTRSFFETVLHHLEHDLDQKNVGPEGRDGLPSVPGPSAHAHPHRWEGVAVIGDDVVADLGEGAIELGLWRVLVKTGKYRPGDEGRKDVLPPDQVCASFAEFVGMLMEQRKSAS